MPGTRTETLKHKDSSYSLLEQDYQIREWLKKDRASRNHQQHVHFGKRVPDGINGRPHKMGVWIAGILTHLGPRRR